MAKCTAYLNDVQRATGGTVTNGTFSYYIGPGVKVGDKLEIEGLNSANEVVTDRVLVDILPAINAVYVEGTHKIAGEYSGDIDHVVVYVNGRRKETGGEFTEEETFELPLDITIKPTDKIEVEGLDSNKEVVVEKQPVEVVKDLTITE